MKALRVIGMLALLLFGFGLFEKAFLWLGFKFALLNGVWIFLFGSFLIITFLGLGFFFSTIVKQLVEFSRGWTIFAKIIVIIYAVYDTINFGYSIWVAFYPEHGVLRSLLFTSFLLLFIGSLIYGLFDIE